MDCREEYEGDRDRSSTAERSGMIKSVSWGTQTIYYFDEPSKGNKTEPIPPMTSREIADQEMIVDMSEVFGKDNEMDFLGTRRRRKSVCFEEEFDLDSWASSPVYSTYSISNTKTDESMDTATQKAQTKTDIYYQNQKLEVQVEPVKEEQFTSQITSGLLNLAYNSCGLLQEKTSEALSGLTKALMELRERIQSWMVNSVTSNQIQSTAVTRGNFQLVQHPQKKNIQSFKFLDEGSYLLVTKQSELFGTTPGLFSPRLSTSQKTSISVSSSDLSRVFRSAISISRWHRLSNLANKDRSTRSRRAPLRPNARHWKKSCQQFKLPHYPRRRFPKKNGHYLKAPSIYQNRGTKDMSTTGIRQGK